MDKVQKHNSFNGKGYFRLGIQGVCNEWQTYLQLYFVCNSMRRTFGPKRGEILGEWKNCTRTFMTCNHAN
jgi:hypothetical protein